MRLPTAVDTHRCYIEQVLLTPFSAFISLLGLHPRHLFCISSHSKPPVTAPFSSLFFFSTLEPKMRKIYLLWAWLAIASAVPQEMPRKTREDAAIRKRDDWMSVSVKIVGSMLTIAALWRPTQRALSDLRGRRRARPNLPPQSNAAQPPEPPPQVPEVPLAPPVPPHSKTLPEVFDALVNDTPDQLKWCIVLDCLGLVPDEVTSSFVACVLFM